MRSFEFITKYVRNHKGEPFNPIDYPWTEQICDTWDDPETESMAFQFAARTGKTQLAMSLMVAAVANDPTTWMYGNANETLVKDTVREKWYPMFERCVPTRKWVPTSKNRIQTRVNLRTCQGYCAWSGSPTQLADKDPKYLHAGEVDKWTKQKSDEADSLDLFLERGLEIPDRKAIVESTPQITNRSRIEKHLLAGWNCRLNVPCPRCGHYQPLVFGDGARDAGGVVFEKLDGKLHPQTAYQTARYLCGHCFQEIHDDQRRGMINKCIWVPEGQYVTKSGKVRGTMKNPGPNPSYQLSRLYAPTFSFGQCARGYVQMYQKDAMHNWLNSWMGWTWQPVMVEDEWEVVAERISLDYELGTVPMNGYFPVAAVDVQVDHFVYMVMAFGHESRAWVVDYGTCTKWKDVKDLLRTPYKHADGGPAMPIMMTLIDAKDGNRQDEVIDFCRNVNRDDGPFVWPCYGSKAGAMGMVPYRRNVLDEENKMGKSIGRQSTTFGVVSINTNYWQQWIHNCLFKREPDTRGSLAIPESVAADQDLFEQWMNEMPDTRLDMTNHDSFVWVVVNEGIPVDFRDVARYCRCAAEVYTRGNWARVKKQRHIPVRKTQPVESTSEKTPRHQSKIQRRPNWVRKLSHKRYGRR